MSKTGDVLRAAREAKGVSLAQAEQDTRIKARYLDALESGVYSALPAPAYARGYLRTYGQYLGLDVPALVESFNAECDVAEPQGVQSEVKIRGGGPVVTPGPIVAFGVVVLALVAAFYLYQQYTQYVGTASPSPTPGSSLAVAPTMQPTIVIAPPPTATPAPSPTATPTSLPTVTVEVKIIQDCWMKVDVDGVEAYQGVLRPGDTRSWTGKDKVFMRAGYPSGVQVTVNGKPQGLLAPSGTGAINVTWTATQPQGVTTPLR